MCQQKKARLYCVCNTYLARPAEINLGLPLQNFERGATLYLFESKNLRSINQVTNNQSIRLNTTGTHFLNNLKRICHPFPSLYFLASWTWYNFNIYIQMGGYTCPTKENSLYYAFLFYTFSNICQAFSVEK